MAILAYAGFFRYDEVSRIRRSDILFEKFFMEIFIEKSKCDQYRAGAWVHIARTNRRHTSPYKVLTEYLETADIDSGGDEFIFRGCVKTKAGHKLKGNMPPQLYDSKGTHSKSGGSDRFEYQTIRIAFIQTRRCNI